MAWSAACARRCCWPPIRSPISKGAARRSASTSTFSAYRSSSTTPESRPPATACLPISCALCASEPLAGASAVGNRPLRQGERGSNAIGVADIEKHSFGNFSGHLARLEIQHKKGLAGFQFARIIALLPDPGENRPRVIAEIHRELHQLFRTRHFLHAFDRADADVKRFERLDGHQRFDGRRRKFIHSSPPVLCRVRRKRNSEIATFIADGRTRYGAQWNDASPDGERIVGEIVLGRADPHLCGGLGERQTQNARSLELFFIGLARVV